MRVPSKEDQSVFVCLFSSGVNSISMYERILVLEVQVRRKLLAIVDKTLSTLVTI